MFRQDLHNDQLLLQRIPAGDEAAFKGLYDRYWQDVYSLALAYLKSPAWAEDILQEVFIKLWDRRDRLPQVAQFDSWLFILTRNVLITALRQKALQVKKHQQYIRDLPSSCLSHAGDLSATELEQYIQQSLRSLTPKQRMIFSLSRREGKTLEEIARELGLSKKTVSNTLTIVVNHIRSYLHLHHALCAAGWAFLWELFTGFPD